MRTINEFNRPVGVLLRQAVQASRRRQDSRARALFSRAVERDATGRAHHFYIRFLWRRGLLHEARVVAGQLHELAMQQNSQHLLSTSANALACLCRELGEPHQASGWQQQSLQLDSAGDQLGCDLSNRGNDALLAGDLELAQQLFQSALDWDRHHGSRADEAADFGSLGMVALLQGLTDDARDYFRTALYLHRQVRDRVGLAQDWLNLGQVAVVDQQWPRAERCFENALRVAVNARHVPLVESIQQAQRDTHRRQRSTTDPLRN